MIETMMQWKALSAFGNSTLAGGDTSLASTICCCLNYQQGLKRDENLRPKLISSINIEGKTIYHLAYENCCEL